MKVKSLEMENFKSTPNRNITLSKINVFLGANGRGKTSAQNAFRYVLNGKLPKDPIRHGEDFLDVSAVLDDGQDTKIERLLYLPDTYKVNGQEVKDKVFLKEVDKYKAVCEANGYTPTLGKETNSFFLLQNPSIWWTFMETGKIEGARIRGIKELELEMEDGTTLYMRSVLPSKVMVDGKKVTAKALAEMIRDRMQGDEKALDLVTSSAVMNAMEMTDFAKYLISVVPIKVDFEKLSELAKLTKEEEVVLRPLFPVAPEPITTAHVADAYKALYAKRTEVSKTMDEWKKRSIYNGTLPIQDGNMLQARLDEVKRTLGRVDQIKKAWEIYSKRLSDRQRILDNLDAWKKEYAALGSVAVPDVEMLNGLKQKDMELRKDIESLTRDAAGLERANQPILKMLSALDTTICPLCDKLVCSTDKTSCKQDLERSVEENNRIKESLLAKVEEKRKTSGIVAVEIEKIYNQQKEFVRKQTIEQQIESLERTLPEEPAKPQDVPDTASLLDEERKLMERFRQVTLYEECERAKTEYEKTKQIHDLYCSLVKKAEPKKGLLTNTILEYVLNPFCGHVNEFLKQISGDIEVSFRMSDDGLQVYCRPHNRSCMVPVDALSTGEKMLVVFALMEMVSSISNSRILVFDCIENLDAANIDALIALLLKPEIMDRYDHVILSVVDHKSIVETIDKYRYAINVIDF